MNWNPNALPDLSGQVHAVTGSTGGIGYFAAEQLASAGAEVVLVSRSEERMQHTQEVLRSHVPGASVRSVRLDLTSLDSVAAAGAALAELPRLDGVFLNGGPMNFSTRARTHDGLPLMVGAHMIANAALAMALLPRLARQDLGHSARIVHASTGFVTRFGMSVTDLEKTPRTGVGAYTKAKTATEVFAHELDRRLRAAGLPVSSIITRPGVGVDAKTPSRQGISGDGVRRRRNPFTPWAQGKDAAAWSGVRALSDPDAEGGDYFAPREGMRGAPVLVASDPRTRTPEPGVAQRVWGRVLELSGVHAVV
ncbi:SDR family NAD(P)-dependent oxidoreductase [Microbacterium soli]|uniref:SDR family NAD(P)-dependent oxidoreductase n=1 Tax=Microbacterium soli TaxID=446075 RepID=A0ABP7NG84_9MICO